MKPVVRFSRWIVGWRTMIVAALFGIIDVLDATDIAPILPPAWLPWWTVLHAPVFAYLRFISTTPVGSSEPAVSVKQMVGGKK